MMTARSTIQLAFLYLESWGIWFFLTYQSAGLDTLLPFIKVQKFLRLFRWTQTLSLFLWWFTPALKCLQIADVLCEVPYYRWTVSKHYFFCDHASPVHHLYHPVHYSWAESADWAAKIIILFDKGEIYILVLEVIFSHDCYLKYRLFRNWNNDQAFVMCNSVVVSAVYLKIKK